MELTVLGSTGGCPGRGNPASGYLVRHGATALWLEAGTGTFMELARHLDPGAVDAVVLSHVHVDHCVDLFGLYGYLAFGPSGRIPVPVHAPEGVLDHLAGFARATEGHVFHTVFEARAVAPGDVVEVGELVLRFGDAVHPVPAVSVRIDAPGGSLAYSGDTGPGSGLAELAAGVDLLLCEATILGPRADRTYPYHLTAAEAGALAEAAGARRLVVTHVAALAAPEAAVDEAAAVYRGPVTWAAPGSTFPIPEDEP